MELRDLVTRYAGDGVLRSILLRPSRDAGAISVEHALAITSRGLGGDRAAQRVSRQAGGSKRQVTLFQYEHLALLAGWLGRDAIAPACLRRNLVVSGLNLLSARSPLRDMRVVLRIGEHAAFELTGPCDPCSKMERDLGAGAYNAMRGHGGVTARVLADGRIQLGDRVWVDADDESWLRERHGHNADRCPLTGG